MAKRKTARVRITLADCVMEGGIKGRIFRDVHNHYNRFIRMERRYIATTARYSLRTLQAKFPLSVNKPLYEVISWYWGRTDNLRVKVYLRGIRDKRHTQEVLFWFFDHGSDALYDDDFT